VAGDLSRNDAALKNRAQLAVANLPAEQPEHINSLEVGYKSVLDNNKLAIDADAYCNSYKNFLDQVDVAVPTSGDVGSDAAVLDMLTRIKQVRYRVYTNAKQVYHSYGASVGLTYNFYQKYVLSGNFNYNNLIANDNLDVFVTGFNTPKYVMNISFGNREIVKNLGFNVVWRCQDSFFSQSPLADGVIPAYQTVDAQITYRLPQPKQIFKLGGANVFNNRYVQYAAGPTIGGLYYLAITWDVIRL
jgi:iron complex outermembrane receptor protein